MILGLFVLAFGWEVILACAVLVFFLAVLQGILGERSGMGRHFASLRVAGIEEEEESGGEQGKRKGRAGVTGKLKGQFFGLGKGSCCGIDIQETPQEESREKGKQDTGSPN